MPTADHLENMRHNIAHYPWAREIRDEAITAANRIVDKPFLELAGYVPDPRVPRSIYVHETGCPICGLEQRKHGTASWIISRDKPYKVQCPSCDMVFPSNDFAAFLASGMQDPSLLDGEYPDDGYGWASPRDPEHKYWFVGWYNHWMVMTKDSCGLLSIIDALYHAYLFSDDPRYAHKCAAVLWQMAVNYPAYDYVNQSRIGTEYDPNYHGKLLYHTWETFVVRCCVMAYDAIAPVLAGPCPELEQFTGQTSGQIRHLIAEQLLRAMAAYIVDETGHIYGNYGMHQEGLLMIAAALRDTPGKPSSEEMVEWILDNEEYGIYVYMPLYDALYNLVGRDGCATESPKYNNIWVRNLARMAPLLQLNGVDVTQLPRFKKLYEWEPRIVCAGEFTPALGDTGNITHRHKLFEYRNYLFAYKAYKEPRYARILLEMEPGRADRDIFDGVVGDEELARVAATAGSIGYGCEHLADYGLAILQNGDERDPTAVSLFYGQPHTHAHRDMLQLDIYAQGAALIPDFGLPETTNSMDPRRGGFFFHTIAHNTVMVDEQKQKGSGHNECIAYDPGPVCQYMEARGEGAYDQCEEYRRAVALIGTAEGHSYAVDIFRVEGGRQHDWLVHGTQADFSSNLPLSQAQTEGTLAGPDVAYGYFYDDEALRDAPEGSVNYFRYKGSSFQYLYNVQEAALEPAAWARWDVIPDEQPTAPAGITANEGAFIRAHLVGADERILVCDGKPQQNYSGAVESVKFLLRRRSGDHLSSAFTTVFEPGAHAGFISSVERLETAPEQLVALKIRLQSGAIHYYFNSPVPHPEYPIADGIRFAGQVGHLQLDRAGTITGAYVYNGALGRGDFELSASGPLKRTIGECDYAGNRITLNEPIAAESAIRGRTLLLNTGPYRTTFVAEDVEAPATVYLGDEFPAAGRLVVKGVKPERREIETPTLVSRARPGMFLVDEAFRPVARLAPGTDARKLILDRDLEPGSLAGGEGVVRAWIMPYGPGTEVLIPASSRYEGDRF